MAYLSHHCLTYAGSISDWLSVSCYMAAVVAINDGHSRRVEARHINQPNKSKLLLHKPLLSL